MKKITAAIVCFFCTLLSCPSRKSKNLHRMLTIPEEEQFEEVEFKREQPHKNPRQQLYDELCKGASCKHARVRKILENYELETLKIDYKDALNISIGLCPPQVFHEIFIKSNQSGLMISITDLFLKARQVALRDKTKESLVTINLLLEYWRLMLNSRNALQPKIIKNIPFEDNGREITRIAPITSVNDLIHWVKINKT